MERETLSVPPATAVQLTRTLSPEIDELSPVTVGAVWTTLRVDDTVVARTAPFGATATARTWWAPSISPLVATLPLAVQLWPSMIAESCPTTTQVPCCRACISTDEKLA